jgi:subfamily B ATP-binding cassette protein HlyB/CyaB
MKDVWVRKKTQKKPSSGTLNLFAERQLTTNDCGLAVCKAALAIAGTTVSRRLLREAMMFDEAGCGFDEIKKALKQHGVQCSYKIIDLARLDETQIDEIAPFIAMIDSSSRNHFILVHSVASGGINILDPKDGKFQIRPISYLRETLKRLPSTADEDIAVAFADEYVARKCDSLGVQYQRTGIRAEAIRNYTRCTYFEHLESRTNFKSPQHKSEYLRELLQSADDSVIPSRFKVFRPTRDGVEIKAPIALSFEAGTGERAIPSHATSPLNKLLHVLSGHQEIRRQLMKVLYLSFAVSLLAVVSVYVSQLLIDEVVPSSNLSTLYAFAAAVFLFRLFDLGVGVVRAFAEVVLSKSIDEWLSGSLHKSIVRGEPESIACYTRGELTMRFNDALRIKSVLSAFIGEYLFSILMLVMSFGLIMLMDVTFGIILLSVIAAYGFVYHKIVPYVQAFEGERFREKSNAVSALLNIVEGHSVIRKHRSEGVFLDDQKVRVNRYLDAQWRSMIAAVIANYLPRLLSVIGGLSIVVAATKMHIDDAKFSIGQILTAVALTDAIFAALRTILKTRLAIQEQEVVISRFFDLRDLETRRGDPHTEACIGSIRFRDVNFRYPSGRFVLSVPSFALQSGDRVMIKGGNGSGKSTFLRVLSGISRKNTGGSISFTDTDGKPMSAEAGFDRVMLVRAEDKIFSDTVAFNITLGHTAMPSKIYEYAKRIGADDFISPENNSLDALIHDHGENLSTGQRRKLLILRALFSSADVFIFDEIFRGIDDDSKLKIAKFFNRFAERKIMIYTSHETIAELMVTKTVHFVDGRLCDVTGNMD